MSDGNQTDHGIIEPITLPRDATLPRPPDGPREYDAYFRIEHTDMDVQEWMRTIRGVFASLSDDLPATTLDAEDKADLLHGMMIVTMDSLAAASPAGPGNGRS